MLVLLAEDDEDYAEIIAQTVRRDSHDVAITGTAAGACGSPRSGQPSLAILDVALPDGSGLDLCRRLRESNAVASGRLPLVHWTGSFRHRRRPRSRWRRLHHEAVPPIGTAGACPCRCPAERRRAAAE